MGEEHSQAAPTRYGRKIPLSELERKELAPQPPPLPERRSKRYWPIVLVLAAIAVVIGVILYSSLTPASGNTPEDTFSGFVEAMNASDAHKAIDFTVDAFIDDTLKAAEIQQVEEIWAEYGSMTITIQSMDVVYRKDMNALVGAEVDAIVAEIESMWNVTVEDSSSLTFSVTVTQGGETNDADGTVPVVKIEGSWYLAPGILSI